MEVFKLVIIAIREGLRVVILVVVDVSMVMVMWEKTETCIADTIRGWWW